MNFLKKTLLLALVVGLVAPIAGCGKKKPDGLPDLQPTTVSMTVDGKGLANANVTFQPVDPKANPWVPAGITDASGKAEIKTSGQFKGAPTGDYKIVVSADDEIDYGEDGPPPKDDPAALENWNRNAHPDSWKRYSPIELKYTNVADTPLEASVQNGKNAFDFDLGSSAHDEVKQEKK